MKLELFILSPFTSWNSMMIPPREKNYTFETSCTSDCLDVYSCYSINLTLSI